MGDRALVLPPSDVRRSQVLGALTAYWPDARAAVEALPVAERRLDDVEVPLRLVAVHVPDWAGRAAVSGEILVPAEVAGQGGWSTVDWWTAAFLLLEGWHERVWEMSRGPIHSYSWRLEGWDSRAWERAWVNRIAMFLAAWAGVDQHVLRPTLRVSHDVDAIRKTTPIRLKQSAMRAAVAVRRRSAPGRSVDALHFVFGRQDWWMIDEVLRLEYEHGVRSTFNVFADPRRLSPRRWLLDPAYRLGSPDGARLLKSLTDGDVRIGLHPSFDSWTDGDRITDQKAHLERCLGRPVRSVRQHWLRFSWEHTWSAQSAAGLEIDSTLMFNDRSGFRNSAAIEWRPWNPSDGRAHSIAAVACGFMDSHQYDYAALAGDDGEHRVTLRDVVTECRAVGGDIDLLWHPHTLSEDYGWREGFTEMLREVAA
mgnify:CR=1 FL=1